MNIEPGAICEVQVGKNFEGDGRITVSIAIAGSEPSYLYTTHGRLSESEAIALGKQLAGLTNLKEIKSEDDPMCSWQLLGWYRHAEPSGVVIPTGE